PQTAGVLDRLARLGHTVAFDAWPAVTVVRRGRLEKVGVGVQFAHQCQPVSMAVDEAGDFVRAVARIADEDEGPVRDFTQQQPYESAQELGRGAVPPAAGAV